MRSTGPPSPCDRWARRAETDSLDGIDGVVDHYAKVIDLPRGADVEQWFTRLGDRLLTYRVFPPDLMRAQVCSADGRLHEGTIIFQRVAVGPLTLEAGVCVVRVWQRQDAGGAELGFTYVTLQGHPERGISTFRISREADDPTITLLIDVRSQAGSWLTRLARPIARRFQIRATRAALAYVAEAIDERPSPLPRRRRQP